MRGMVHHATRDPGDLAHTGPGSELATERIKGGESSVQQVGQIWKLRTDQPV
jgi:hypothetical protein